MHPEPNVKICEFTEGAAWLVGGAPAVEQWTELSEQQQAKLIERIHIACVSPRPLPHWQIRHIDAVTGIFELKIDRPPVRAFSFKVGRDWFITQIEPKPRKSKVIQEAKAAARIRNEYLERQRTNG